MPCAHYGKVTDLCVWYARADLGKLGELLIAWGGVVKASVAVGKASAGAIMLWPWHEP